MKDVDKIYPSYIDNNDFRYIKVDDKYISSIVISDFPRYNTFLSVIQNIPQNVNYDFCMYIKKQDNYKILKELSYSILNNNTEIRTSKKAQMDFDILNRSKEDANLLRKEIQINNQEIFNVNFILTFYSDSKEEILKIIKRFQSILYSKSLYSKVTNFRQLGSYILSLPLNRSEEVLLNDNYKMLTTSALSNVFPFYTRNVFDINGVILGKISSESKLCSIDIFKEKYLNSNMVILGSSGSGKSYFAKLLIIRHYINKKIQYIFDVEGEYIKLTKKLNGEVFSFTSNHINIMEFRKIDINTYGKNVYKLKIDNILKTIQELANIKNNRVIEDLKSAINLAYKNYNITDDVESLYVKSQNKVYLERVMIKNDKFPTLNNVLNYLKINESKKELEKIIKKYPYISDITDININNRIICFDLSRSNISDESLIIKNILKSIVLNANQKIKLNQNIIIYIDEVWKYISDSKCLTLSKYIFELFKTIRKLKASIIIITQDICDIFSKENIDYGKSLLNNCFFKVFFRLDFKDIELLSKISGINEEVLEKVNLLDKGKSIFLFNNNTINLIIQANAYENNIILGEEYEYFSGN